MASEIRVNTINNRSGLGTISITNSGAVFSGVTTFAQIKTTSGEVTVGTGASVYSPATNVLALGTNNEERVRITSSGNVGIGTDNPANRFHATQYTANTDVATFQIGSASAYTGFVNCRVGTTGAGSFIGGLYTPDGSLEGLQGTNGLIFSTSGSNLERLRIDSSGRVGIGTDSPSSIAHIRQSLAGAQLTLDSAAGFGFNIRAINNTSNNTLGLYGTRAAGTGSSGIDVVIGSTNTRSSGRAIMQVQNNGTSLLRVDAGGDVQISNGNLVFSTAGTGIDFSAASGSAAGSTSALLDDYEEGTFTPTITQGFTGITYTTQFGRYRKIGRMVYVQFRITIGGGNRTADSNNIRVNLPFTVDADGDNYATLEGYGTLYTYHPDAFFICFQGESFAALYRRGVNTQAALDGDDFGSTNPFDVIYGGWYYV